MDPVERLALAAKDARFGEHGGVNPSIEVSTTFTVLDAKTLPDIFNGERGPDPKRGACYLYSRSWSPTVHTLGRQLAAMEATEAGYAVSSGMAAISSALLGLLNAGDHVVASNCVYGGTHALLSSYLPAKCGLRVSFVDITDLAAVNAALAAPRTKVLFCETVSNPTLVVADLPALASAAHAVGAALVVDNTFTPLAVTPAKWGADVVVHSLTKFVSGASDIIAGAVCGRASFLEQLMDLHTGPIMLQGPTCDPRIASELLMRLPHLHLRVAEHSRRAAAMAAMLEGLGAKVVYPGLASHAGNAVLSRLLNPGYGYGGLIGLDMGSAPKAEALMERLQNKHGFGLMAVSLGYADTLMSLSAASTSSELSEAERAAAHISSGYVRLSIGITGTLEQRLSQLREAYEFVGQTNGLPPYKATKVRFHNGQVSALLSWPSYGPHEDVGSAGDDAAYAAEHAGLGQGGAPHEAANPIALAAAAAIAGGLAVAPGGPHALAGGPVWRPHPAATDAATAAAAASSLTAAGSLVDGASDGAGSDGEAEGGQRDGASTSPPASGAAAQRGVSRLASVSAPASERPVKVRKLDEDTAVVYTPTPHML